jgi:hypothetical protein
VVCHFFSTICFSLDHYHVLFDGRMGFLFALYFFHLFSKRFLSTKLTFNCVPPRPMNDVHMHMWGYMFPKKGQSEFSCRVSPEVLNMLTSEDDHTLDLVQYAYLGLD